MTSRNIAYLTGVLFFMLSGPVASQDWVDIKNPKELRALYSNKTFRSTFAGVPVVEHYRADGKGILISGELRIPCTWEVKGNDQVCVTDEKGTTNCYQFQRHKRIRDEYVRTRLKTSQLGAFMTILKVEDGIPEF